jgi:hypothetical protein
VPRSRLRFLFPVLAISASLLLVEIVLRLASVSYPAFDRPTVGLREWGVPHAEGWATGEVTAWVKLNAEGARDRDHTVEKPPDTLRVVVVGDSYTSAFHVAMEDAFWAVAERRLSTCAALGGRSVEMISISKDGYGTTEELLALRHFGFKYQPDWVVLAFLTGNDFRNNSRALKDSDRPYFVFSAEQRGGEGMGNGEGEVAARLRLDESYADQTSFRVWTSWVGDLWYGGARHSRLVQLARHLRKQIKLRLERARSAAEVTNRAKGESGGEAAQHVGALAGSEPGLDDSVYLEPTDPAWQSAWRTTEAVIRLMRDETREVGAEFLLMTLSNAIQVNPDAALREAYARQIGSSDLFLPDRRLRRFGEWAEMPVLTLAPILRAWAEENETCVHGFEEPWICQGHWNEYGHRVAGEQLADRLCEEFSSGSR